MYRAAEAVAWATTAYARDMSDVDNVTSRFARVSVCVGGGGGVVRNRHTFSDERSPPDTQVDG